MRRGGFKEGGQVRSFGAGRMPSGLRGNSMLERIKGVHHSVPVTLETVSARRHDQLSDRDGTRGRVPRRRFETHIDREIVAGFPERVVCRNLH